MVTQPKYWEAHIGLAVACLDPFGGIVLVIINPWTVNSYLNGILIDGHNLWRSKAPLNLHLEF